VRKADNASLAGQSVFMPVGVTPRADEMALIEALTTNKKTLDRQLAENQNPNPSQSNNGPALHNETLSDLDFMSDFI
jgi:hypothetical protein